MAIDSYTSLKTAVTSNWLHRTDLANNVDDFIDLFESSFNSEMRVRNMENQSGYSVTNGVLTHPNQWLQWKQIKIPVDGGFVNVEPITEESQLTNYGRESGGLPRFYKTVGTATYLYPRVSVDLVNLTYYQKITSLSASSTSNWLLDEYPGAYLYGTLNEAAPYIGDDARIPVWKERLLETLNRIRNASDRAEHGSQVLRIRPDIKVR